MAKVGSTIKCKHCGKEFTVRFTTEKYCCKACYQEACKLIIAQSNYNKNEKTAKGTMREKVCIVCGTPFYTKRSRTMCCSGACIVQHNRDLVRKRYYEQREKTPKIETPKEESECIVCGAKFIKRNGRQVCCSVECSEWHQKDLIRSYNKKMEAERKAKKNKAKPLTAILKEMKAEGYEPHEYGKYMAMQYMKSH